MSQPQRQLHLGLNTLFLGGHGAAWRMQETAPDAYMTLQYYQHIAKLAEKGTFDAMFLADGPALTEDIGVGPAGRLESTILATAAATATERLGFIVTASTTYNDPYNLARRLATADRLTNGRMGWNAVTNVGDMTARNFGLENHPSHADRYSRAEEFIEVAQKLWDSWEEDVIVADQASGYFGDRAKIHPAAHRGQHFAVAGALNIARSPQGRPVIVQAGASEPGRDLGARYGEVIFAAQSSLAEAQAFYRDMKRRTAGFGRDPGQIKIMPGLSTVIGSTEEEAIARYDALDAFLGDDDLKMLVAQRIGIALDDVDVDDRIPWDRIGDTDAFEGGPQGFLQTWLALARSENLTIRQLARRFRSGHRVAVGAPEQIADTIEEWFMGEAADGFNIMPDLAPSGVEMFVDHVVPELRRRSLFRHEYSGTTLRDHLGLAHPANRYAS